MADLATLGVVVTTKGVTEADRQLNSLSASGKKAEVAATGVERSFKQAGISAGQLKNATRQLPAQFTDIATGLASGQRPLQVLLQQGGQIKDAFGGAGLALRAMAGYVASLISPVTVLAAVALGLAVAWKQGSDEAVEFNKALILTGNYAGTTSDALALAAQRMDDLGSTQRSASAALTAVAGTGRIAREQLETVALAAEQMRIATGKSIDDTVAEFVRLQGDPVKAILKLNETQNFLTLEIYDQIKALQDQGREQDAAALATETYANTINDRTRDIRQSLGFLETSWLDVKQAAAEAWDEILGVGRTDAAGRIQNIDRQLDQLRNGSLASQTSFSAFIAETAVEGIRDLAGGGRDARIRALLQERKQIQDEISRADSEAAKKAAQQRLQQQTIAFEAELATYATAEEKRAKQIIAIRGEADQLIAQAQAQGNDALVQRLEAGAAKAIAAIEAQGAKKPKRERVDNSAKREAERLAREAAKAEEELNKIVRQNAADLGGPAAQAARQYADELLNLVGVEQALAAAGKLTADRERELAIARQQASDLYADQLQDIEDKRTESARQVIEDLELELKLMGLSNVEREKMIALRYANADAASEEGQKIGSLIEQIDAEREKIASQDFLRGEVKGLFQDLIDGSKSAKEAFADFVDSVLAGIAEIIAQRLTEQLLGDFGTTQTGAAGGGIASLFSGLFSGGRAIGGPVSGDRLYGIAEKGPEVLDIRGKKYLIPGADGNVTPMREGSAGGSQNIQQNIYVTGTVDPRSAYQVQREAQLELRMAASR